MACQANQRGSIITTSRETLHEGKVKCQNLKDH